MIDHDVVRLNISMHDAFRVAEIEGLIHRQPQSNRREIKYLYLQQLKYVEPDVEIGKSRV